MHSRIETQDTVGGILLGHRVKLVHQITVGSFENDIIQYIVICHLQLANCNFFACCVLYIRTKTAIR